MTAVKPKPKAAVSDPMREILDHAPAMIWVTTPDGQCTYVNRACFRLTGLSEAEALGFGWLDAIHPDDRAGTLKTYLDANAARAPFQSEYRLRSMSGDYRWAIAAGNPRFAEDGAFLGHVGSVVDIHDRQVTEARFRALTNCVPAFVWFASPDGDLHYLNDRWYEYSGQTAQEALPNGWAETVHPEDVDAVIAAWDDTRARGEGYQMECRFRRRDGVYRWYMVRADPMHTASGAIEAWIGTSIDIHDLKGAEERQALLINELNHRVKNTLATVQGLASQILRASPSPEHFQEGFEDRLISLAQAHDLHTASSWGGARLGDLVARAVAPWRGERIDAQGGDVWLDPPQAVSISMALHELATNAAKYGALSKVVGKVLIRWTRVSSGSGELVRLRWEEHGGPSVSPPKRRGFGSRLLERGLGRELQGTVVLEFPPEGVQCTVTFPMRLPATVPAGEPISS
ncbi:PAS domain S-box protein [Phenylobacterium sp. LjRoot219]|uniref:sensor histidine kinase n=1 Tax=Phenylobacterium sp. LjRoot219 TaxID=3342283 RepID=UPI003ED03DCD